MLGIQAVNPCEGYLLVHILRVDLILPHLLSTSMTLSVILWGSDILAYSSLRLCHETPLCGGRVIHVAFHLWQVSSLVFSISPHYENDCPQSPLLTQQMPSRSKAMSLLSLLHFFELHLHLFFLSKYSLLSYWLISTFEMIFKCHAQHFCCFSREGIVKARRMLFCKIKKF